MEGSGLLMLQRQIEEHLADIEKLLPKEYRLTLLARHTTWPEERNADILLTLDEPAKVQQAIARLVGQGKRGA